MTDLTPTQRLELERVATRHEQGGREVPMVTRAHVALEDLGLVMIGERHPRFLTRIRCTEEGLRVAREGA